MKMKATLKEKYNRTIKYNGITYYFQNMTDEKLQMVWETNPQLRFMFKELPHFEEKMEVIEEANFLTPEERLKEIGINTPEEFNKVVKKVIKKGK